ncbi:reverse transcriptase domain-containing protein, partial [Salmonella sp. s55004]|uniref:reverse transcriptase domain-containing protein n=1 Tax=Salmonella sp. s55004 TaxID=3159675 RepID=UPI0039812F11
MVAVRPIFSGPPLTNVVEVGAKTNPQTASERARRTQSRPGATGGLPIRGVGGFPLILPLTVPEGARPTDCLPVGGRLLQFRLQWELICPDKWILDIISSGYHIEFSSPPPLLGGGKVTQIPSHQDQREVLESEIDLLLLKRAIVRVSDQEGPLYLSSFFLAPKKPNSWRPILNLRPLNSAHIRPKHFRMENLAVILPFLSKQMWAASLDLQDAYLHIPIAEDNQQFLAFRYKGQSYKFRSLPFGLSTAPRVFTMVTRVVIAH